MLLLNKDLRDTPELRRWKDREMVVLVMTEGVRRVELHGDV